MSIIKKHPFAFVILIGIELIGLSGVLAVYEKAWQDWYFAMVGLMFMIGAAIFVTGCIAGIISSICKAKKRKNEKSSRAEKYAHQLAHEYMMNSKFGAIYWLLVILLSPILPVVLVHVLDVYMAGVMVMCFGIMIWMLVCNKDILIGRFYKIRKADKYFSIESGESDELLDSFYGDYVHVYRAESWEDGIPEFICNLLNYEKTLGKSVKCYTVSNEFMCRKYGYEYNKYLDKLVLVPFSQFDINEKNGKTLRDYFDRLSTVRYTDFVNFKYQEKKSLVPEEYTYTDEKTVLMPLTAKLTNLAVRNGNAYISVNIAGDKNDLWKRYYNCLMVLENAESADEIQIEGESHIESCKLNEEKELLITVITVPEEDLEELSDEEFFDGMRKTVRFRYDKLQWYWDGFCDCEKTRKIFEKIGTEVIK